VARRRFRRALRVPVIFVAVFDGPNPWFYLAGVLDIIVFQGGGDGRGYRNMCKIPWGSNSNEGD
jgi:hypothetical protein